MYLKPGTVFCRISPGHSFTRRLSEAKYMSDLSKKCTFTAYGRTYQLTDDADQDTRAALRGTVPVDPAGNPCIHPRDPHWYDWSEAQGRFIKAVLPRPQAEVIPLHEGIDVAATEARSLDDLTLEEKFDYVLNNADWYGIMQKLLLTDPVEFLKLRARLYQPQKQADAPLTVVVQTVQENNNGNTIT